MALSPEQIFDAANALYAEGEKPSTVNVYKRLGKGSLTTIGKYLKEWRPPGPPSSSLSEVPEEVEEALRRFSRELWRRVSAVAEERLSAVQKEAKEEAGRLQADFEEASQMVDSLGERLEEADRARVEREAQCTHLKEELERVRGEFSVTTTLHAQDRLRLEALEEEITQERDRRREAEGERATLRERVEQLEKQLRDTQAERADLSFQVTQLLGEREAAKGETQAVRKEMELLRGELQGVKNFAREMQEKASAEAQISASLRGEMKALRERAEQKRR